MDAQTLPKATQEEVVITEYINAFIKHQTPSIPSLEASKVAKGQQYNIHHRRTPANNSMFQSPSRIRIKEEGTCTFSSLRQTACCSLREKSHHIFKDAGSFPSTLSAFGSMDFGNSTAFNVWYFRVAEVGIENR